MAAVRPSAPAPHRSHHQRCSHGSSSHHHHRHGSSATIWSRPWCRPLRRGRRHPGGLLQPLAPPRLTRAPFPGSPLHPPGLHPGHPPGSPRSYHLRNTTDRPHRPAGQRRRRPAPALTSVHPAPGLKPEPRDRDSCPPCLICPVRTRPLYFRLCLFCPPGKFRCNTPPGLLSLQKFYNQKSGRKAEPSGVDFWTFQRNPYPYPCLSPYRGLLTSRTAVSPLTRAPAHPQR
jgi:hypothetical protein